MNRSIPAVMLCWVGVVALAATGCGRDAPDLGQVSGTVTLDGKALPNARVVFQPMDEGGSASEARTDENGYYELMYLYDMPGALPGKYKVRVSTYLEDRDANDNPIFTPERVPPNYNEQTTLVEEVKTGSQTIDLKLTGALR